MNNIKPILYIILYRFVVRTRKTTAHVDQQTGGAAASSEELNIAHATGGVPDVATARCQIPFRTTHTKRRISLNRRRMNQMTTTTTGKCLNTFHAQFFFRLLYFCIYISDRTHIRRYAESLLRHTAVFGVNGRLATNEILDHHRCAVLR